MKRTFKLAISILVSAFAAAQGAGNAMAQETSLLHQPYAGPVAQPFIDNAQPSGVQPSYYPGNASPSVGITSASWTYQPAPPLRTFKKNDIITLRVDEIGRMLAQGNAQKRRNGQFSATLSDWIKLSNFTLGPAAQRDGDPEVAFESEDSNRNQSIVETRETLTFNIAATIVDIRPNGNLVLEARKSIRVNDNVWETSLSGTCRAIDVAPDNVVLSKDVLDLEIHKEDQGQLRDGYRRGWFTRWFDRLQPF
jgi:flagellar L-ring protein FlgH